MEIKMVEVSKDEFYEHIGDKDAVLTLVTDYPYTAHWKMRKSGKLIAKAVDSYPEGKVYPLISKYYIEK